MSPPEPPVHDETGRPPYDPLVRYCLLVIAVVVVLVALAEARSFAAPTLIAGLVALALAPLVERLERLRLPAALAAAAVVLGATGALLFGLWFLLPSVEALEETLPEIVQEVETRIRDVAEDVEEEFGAPPEAPPPEPEPAPAAAAAGDVEAEPPPEPEPEPGDEIIASGQRFLADLALSAPEMAATILYGGFLSLFLLIQRGSLARGVIAVAPEGPARYRIARAMRDVRRDVSSYLLAITAINTCLGVAVGLAFWALEMPSPALWGLGMTLLNFAPYIGPAIMNVVAFTAGVFWYGDVGLALYPLAALLALNTLEGWIVTPLTVGRQVHVNVLAVLLAVSFGAWIWGAAGALIGTPALIVTRAFIVRLRVPRRRRPLSGGRRAIRRLRARPAARRVRPPGW